MPAKNLAEALVAFQAEAPPIVLDATNPHFRNKFASLAGVMKSVRPVLAKHGLALTQHPTYIDGAGPALRTKLWHVSGEFEEDTMLLLLTKNDPQGQGSALTYARRYAVLAKLGLVGDEEDDGNAATKSAAQQSSSPAAGADPGQTARKAASAPPAAASEEKPKFKAPGSDEPPTDDQIKALKVLLADAHRKGWLTDEGHDELILKTENGTRREADENIRKIKTWAKNRSAQTVAG